MRLYIMCHTEYSTVQYMCIQHSEMQAYHAPRIPFIIASIGPRRHRDMKLFRVEGSHISSIYDMYGVHDPESHPRTSRMIVWYAAKTRGILPHSRAHLVGRCFSYPKSDIRCEDIDSSLGLPTNSFSGLSGFRSVRDFSA